MIRIGVIGGSGLEDPSILKEHEEINSETPFGSPSSTLLHGTLQGTPVVILSRHGQIGRASCRERV